MLSLLAGMEVWLLKTFIDIAGRKGVVVEDIYY